MDRVADRSWAEGSVDEKVGGPAARDAEPAPGDLNASRRHTAPSRSDIRAQKRSGLTTTQTMLVAIAPAVIVKIKKLGKIAALNGSAFER